MTREDDVLRPSLLERESRGGDISEGGITYQASVVLASVPQWLAREGFTALLREGMVDAEAKFFIPGRGYAKEAIEVKDHPVPPAEFWREIDRFRAMDARCAGEYRWFTLACTGLSEALHPLKNSLRRIRGPHGFYEEGYPIASNSYEGYARIIEDLEHTREEATFLYEKVALVDDLSPNRSHGQALFKEAMRDHLGAYADATDRALGDIYADLNILLQTHRNTTIPRLAIERVLRQRLPDHARPAIAPVHLLTTTGVGEAEGDQNALRFAWHEFFGGEDRAYPPPEAWERRILGELRQTKSWLRQHRQVKRIRLTGNRRLSASLACGWAFSAVAGFAIEVEQRTEVWPTDAHAGPDTPPYTLRPSGSVPGLTGDRLIVSIGIIREIDKEVEAHLARVGDRNLPTLHLWGSAPVLSASQANLIVGDVKSTLSDALVSTGARQLDLYFAGPAALAVFLGHRLNATAPIRCHERIAVGHYVPTCVLTPMSA